MRGGEGLAELLDRQGADQATNTSSGVGPTGHPEQLVDSNALLARLRMAMQRKQYLEARWNGSVAGLQDASRSGMDMSMTTMLKSAGFSYQDTKALLLKWPHGAGAERTRDERYFQRMWNRCGALADDDHLAAGMPPPSPRRRGGFPQDAVNLEPWPDPLDFLGRQ